MKVLFSGLERGLSLLQGFCISLAPETYSEGGSLIDDVDVTFLALKFVTWDYGKQGNKLVPLLKVDMQPDGTQDVHSQYYSCGDLEHFQPTADGETLQAVSQKAKENGGISKQCNAAMFLSSLVQAGVASGKLASERISDLAGMKVHVTRVKRPKDNIKRDEGARDPQVLIVSRLISVPWESQQQTANANLPLAAAAQRTQTAGNPTAGGAVNTASQTNAPNTSDGGKWEPVVPPGEVLDDGALAFLTMEVLRRNGGSMKKMDLMQQVYKAATLGAIASDAKDPEGKPARTTVSQRMYSDTFLGSQPYWRYDGGVVTLQ